jgi:hypothetical protein
MTPDNQSRANAEIRGLIENWAKSASVAQMERSAIRDLPVRIAMSLPHFASLHAGYELKVTGGRHQA